MTTEPKHKRDINIINVNGSPLTVFSAFIVVFICMFILICMLVALPLYLLQKLSKNGIYIVILIIAIIVLIFCMNSTLGIF